MGKIGIVGDLHIAPVPSNRIDDYFAVGLNKIEQIAQNCNYVVFLGDIFTSAKVEEQYVISLIQHLFYCSNTYNTQFYTIIGNHDVVHEDENNLQNSSLGVLAACGCIKVITPQNPITIDDYTFHTIPVNYKRAKQQGLPKLTEKDVLLIHHEYETGTNAFFYEDLKDVGCKMVFFGHDHKPMEGGRTIYPEFTAYRSGSIMRNRADEYNFSRSVYYYTLQDGVVGCQAITIAPAQNVFKIEALTRQNFHKEKFTESINVVIDKYKQNISTQSRFSIKNILIELGAPEKVLSGIEKKHNTLGERFE